MIRFNYIIKYCLSILCILVGFSTVGTAQKKPKELIVNIVGADGFPNDKLSYSLLRGNSLITIVTIDKKHTFSKSHQLGCGIYDIEIYKNDSLFQTYSNINVDCFLTTRFFIRLDNQTSYSLLDNVSDKPNSTSSSINGIDGIFGFYYTQNFLDENENSVQHLGRYRMGINNHRPLGKYLSLGYQYSFSLAFSYPEKNQPLIDTFLNSNERYSYLSFDLGLFLRICAYNQNKTDKGFAIDLGINYQSPLLFRHASVFGNQKLITRYIHKWNDLEAYVRLKRKFFSLFGGYRIFDYIKYNYPQNPKFIFGFELTAPID